MYVFPENGLHLKADKLHKLTQGMVETVTRDLVNQNPIPEPKPNTLKPDRD